MRRIRARCRPDTVIPARRNGEPMHNEDTITLDQLTRFAVAVVKRSIDERNKAKGKKNAERNQTED